MEINLSAATRSLKELEKAQREVHHIGAQRAKVRLKWTAKVRKQVLLEAVVQGISSRPDSEGGDAVETLTFSSNVNAAKASCFTRQSSITNMVSEMTAACASAAPTGQGGGGSSTTTTAPVVD